MKDKIKLDIVSDVTCPWCVIGYKRVERAISELDIQHLVEIEWQPFELNPGMSSEGEELRAHMARKYGTTPEDTEQTLSQIASHGKELGFTIDFFDGFKMVNTRDLHILLDYAKESGKQTELKLSLFKAFFSEKKNVTDESVLRQIVQQVGLSVDEAMTRLGDETIRNQVVDHELYWKNLSVTAVPTMFFNGSGALVGAQPVDVYKQVFRDLLRQRNNPSLSCV